MQSAIFRKSFASITAWLNGEGGSREALVRAPTLLLDQPIAEEPDIQPEAEAARAVRSSPNRLLLGRLFDAAHPVRTRNELFGREHELDELLTAAFDFSQHCIVIGARGSGKTSLVRVFGDYADQKGMIAIFMACEPGASFSDLVRTYLRGIPASALAPGARDRFRAELAALPANFGPRAFVELVAENVAAPVVFILDEFDRITDPAVRADIAAAMKLLSDVIASVLFMLVGIARNVSDVVDSHPSLRRHMRTVTLGRIEPASVDALIDLGESAGLRFAADSREVITRAACGSPFHVRMFCHHAGLAALKRSSETVTAEDARKGLATAVAYWAAMNRPDADIFTRLVESRSDLAALEHVARAAAVADIVEAQDGHAIARLGEAVCRGTGKDDPLIFRDSVAPQFLIALILLSQASAAAAQAPIVVPAAEASDALYH